ncbi:hypothetical protein HU200_041118 [Digitaria exilis]|uniref:Uncharacterized protein n=1 Tax=Digitaria exilis TaxID=1010633 RepID=A0A835EE75_9POAL|nr:hypothetical protein HU200_041118 [Digitaria exilis]
MEDNGRRRIPFGDVTNTINRAGSSASADEEHKRQEKNRKQREWRARKKVEETDEQREERNKKQREYRARRKEETSTPSEKIQISLQDEPSEWLHRNDTYVPRARPNYDLYSLTPGVASSNYKLLKKKIGTKVWKRPKRKSCYSIIETTRRLDQEAKI